MGFLKSNSDQTVYRGRIDDTFFQSSTDFDW